MQKITSLVANGTPNLSTLSTQEILTLAGKDLGRAWAVGTGGRGGPAGFTAHHP